MDIYISTGTATLLGRIVDSEGPPVTSYTAVLLDFPDRRQGTSYRLLGGWLDEKIGLVGVPPRKYRLLALTPALLDVAPKSEVFNSYGKYATTVDLAEGQTVELNVIAIEAHPFAPKSE